METSVTIGKYDIYTEIQVNDLENYTNLSYIADQYVNASYDISEYASEIKNEPGYLSYIIVVKKVDGTKQTDSTVFPKLAM